MRKDEKNKDTCYVNTSEVNAKVVLLLEWEEGRSVVFEVVGYVFVKGGHMIIQSIFMWSEHKYKYITYILVTPF